MVSTSLWSPRRQLGQRIDAKVTDMASILPAVAVAWARSIPSLHMEAVQLELDLGDIGQAPSFASNRQNVPHPATPEGMVVDQNRNQLLRLLYQLEDRDRPDHPRCGTFTGLAEAFHLRMGRLVVNEALKAPVGCLESLDLELKLYGDPGLLP